MAPRRSAPGTPILETTPQYRELQAIIWVFCEGKNTEIGWLQYLRRRCRNIGVQINDRGGCGVPSTVAELAMEKRHQLNQSSSKFESADEVWAVFDRDEHPRVDQAIDICQKGGVGVVFSNACFELWPLLFFEMIYANKHRHELQSRLNQLHPFYHHGRGAQVDWSTIEPKEQDAIALAIRLHSLATRRQEGLFENPHTTAWVLHQRLLNAKDKDAAWMVELCNQHPCLRAQLEWLAEPLRSRSRELLSSHT